MDILEKLFNMFLALVLSLLILWFFSLVVATVITKADCLEAGWAKSDVTWNLKRYCIREENEYEITIPLENILIEQE